MFTISLIFTFLFIFTGLIGWKYNGFVNRLSAEQKIIAGFQNYDYTQTLRRYTCLMGPENTFNDFKEECYGLNTSEAYMIWGDSYAAASYKGIKNIHNDIIQLTSSACPPLIDTIFTDRINCLNINNYIKEKIKKLQPKKIFLQSNWHTYKKEDVVGNLYKTINYIKTASPHSKIVILGSVPQWEPSLPNYLLRKNISLTQDEYIVMPYYKNLIEVDKKLSDLADLYKVEFISLLNKICIGENCLVITKYNTSYWLTSWDNGHLTEAGSIFLYTKLKDIINN